jgi:hypothetical protein
MPSSNYDWGRDTASSNQPTLKGAFFRLQTFFLLCKYVTIVDLKHSHVSRIDLSILKVTHINGRETICCNLMKHHYSFMFVHMLHYWWLHWNTAVLSYLHVLSFPVFRTSGLASATSQTTTPNIYSSAIKPPFVFKRYLGIAFA